MTAKPGTPALRGWLARVPVLSSQQEALEWGSGPMLNAAAAAVRSLARSGWGIFVAAVLPIASYGAYSVLLTTAAIAAQASLLGTSQTILREPGRRLPVGGLLLHSVILASAVLGVAVVVAPLRDPRYPWLLAALTLGLIGYGIGVTRVKAAGAFADVLRAELVGGVALAIAIGIVLLGMAGKRREVDYGLVVMLEAGAMAALLVAVAQSPGGRVSREEWRVSGLGAVLPSVYSVGGLVLLDLLIWRRLEVYFLQVSPDGLRGVAVFGLASQISALLLLLPWAILEAWSPALAAEHRVGWDAFETLFHANRRVYRRVLAVLLLAAVLATPLLVRVAFPKYWPWMWQIQAFVMIRVVCSYAGFHSAAMYATKRERWLYVAVIVGGAVGIASNALLTPRLGLRGALVAYALTQLTVALATLVAFERSKQRATRSHA